MFKLICVEFKKLRRRREVLFMLLAAFIMPAVSLFYFYTHRDMLTDIGLYKQAILSFNIFLILPALLGILSATIVYREQADDVFKQLLIIPLKKEQLMLAKWAVTLVFSEAFMIISTLFTISVGLCLNLVSLDIHLIVFVLLKVIEAAAVLSVSNIPILATAFSSKGYLLPCCAAIVYAFLGFIFASANPYFIPSASAIFYIEHDLPNVVLPKEYEPFSIIMCFIIWTFLSIIIALRGMERE